MKKIISLFCVLIVCFGVTGCIKRDSMENITIYTTNYPSYFVTKKLYGKFSKIESIYPKGVNIGKYNLTEKQVKDYSDSSLFIFNGLSKEKKIVNKMRKYNKDLKIIDTTLSMEYTYDMNELWLDPANLLMMAQNIKTGFNEYIDSYYLSNNIDQNYENLKIEVSNLDAKFKDVVLNGNTKVIAASSNMFKYLEKYGLTVYVLDPNDSNIQITTNEVRKLINSGRLKYVFVRNDEEENEVIKGLGAQTQKWHTLANLSESDSNDHKDYFDIMNENLELLKNELYK
ncbi:MAG: zinc ABC transporter substrate-binding protein [Bacilli bacterium]|nr:zinc ABC transporter substrate-binding protein [Bacilli bacterium]